MSKKYGTTLKGVTFIIEIPKGEERDRRAK